MRSLVKRLRTSFSSKGSSSQPEDSPMANNDTRSHRRSWPPSSPDFLFGANETDYPYLDESNAVPQNEQHSNLSKDSQENSGSSASNKSDSHFPKYNESNEMPQEEEHSGSSTSSKYSHKHGDILARKHNTTSNHAEENIYVDKDKWDSHHIDSSEDEFEGRDDDDARLKRKEKQKEKKRKRRKGKKKEVSQKFKRIETVEEWRRGYLKETTEAGNVATAEKNEVDKRDSKISGSPSMWKVAKEFCHFNGKDKEEDKEEESLGFSKFFQTNAETVNSIDDENTGMKEEEKEETNGRFWNKKPFFSVLGRKRSKDVSVPEVFPNFDLTASGNVPGRALSEFRRKYSGMNAGSVYDDQSIREGPDGVWMLVNSTQSLNSNDNPTVEHQEPSVSGDIQEGNNFHTKIVQSLERDGEIIDSERVTPKITVILSMYKAPHKQPTSSTPITTHQKTNFQTARAIKKVLSPRSNDDNSKKVRKPEKVAQNVKNFIPEKPKRIDSGKSGLDPIDTDAALRNQVSGRKLPRVNQNPIIGKSNTVKSVRPTIEGGLVKERSKEIMTRGGVVGLQTTGQFSHATPEDALEVSTDELQIVGHVSQQVPENAEDVPSQSDEVPKHFSGTSDKITHSRKRPTSLPPLAATRLRQDLELVGNRRSSAVAYVHPQSDQNAIGGLHHVREDDGKSLRQVFGEHLPVNEEFRTQNPEWIAACEEGSMVDLIGRISENAESSERAAWGTPLVANRETRAEESPNPLITKPKGCLKSQNGPITRKKSVSFSKSNRMKEDLKEILLYKMMPFGGRLAAMRKKWQERWTMRNENSGGSGGSGDAEKHCEMGIL